MSVPILTQVGVYAGTTNNYPGYWNTVDPATGKTLLDHIKTGLPGSHVRLMCYWPDIEPNGPTTPASAGWPNAAIKAIQDRGLGVHLCVCKTPAWAQQIVDDTKGPDDPSEYGKFLGRLEMAYPGITIEVWNEPNAGSDTLGFLHVPVTSDRATVYADLVKAAVANCSLELVIGNADGRYQTSAPNSYAVDDWYTAVASHLTSTELKSSLVRWGIHNYSGTPSGFPTGVRIPEFKSSGGKTPWSVFDAMVIKGVKPPALTEIGYVNNISDGQWGVDGNGVPDGHLCDGTFDRPDPTGQVNKTQRHIIHALGRKTPYYSIMFQRDIANNNKGLFDVAAPQWTARPVWTAVCDLVDRLKNTYFIETIDVGKNNYAYHFRIFRRHKMEKDIVCAWSTIGEILDYNHLRASSSVVSTASNYCNPETIYGTLTNAVQFFDV